MKGKADDPDTQADFLGRITTYKSPKSEATNSCHYGIRKSSRQMAIETVSGRTRVSCDVLGHPGQISRQHPVFAGRYSGEAWQVVNFTNTWSWW
jgi:hypothetical protein